MSFLNALASDGLSVGLRLYTDRLNSRPSFQSACNPVDDLSSSPEIDENPLVPSAVVDKPAKPTPLKPLTPEEIAANRADAQARLRADGSLGQLQATGAEKQAGTGSPTEGAGDGGPTGEGVKADQGGSPSLGAGVGMIAGDMEKLLELQKKDKMIRAEVRAAKMLGEEGTSNPQFTYERGEDNKRYITNITWSGGNKALNQESEKGSSQKLNDAEKKQVEEMKARDREVRQHEQAHVAASGGMAGAPVYEYQTGPDGRRYANGGYVDVRTSGSSDPEVALREAEQVRQAATAPAGPSSQDVAVAAQASVDIQKLKAAKNEPESGETGRKNYDGAYDSLGGESGKQGNGLDEAALGYGSYNGSSFGQQVVGAYAAVKYAAATQTARPFLARV